MAYPYPNSTRFVDFFRYANIVTGGWAMTLILVAVFFISFFSLKFYPTHKAFAGASFITLIGAIIFRVLGFITDRVLILAVICVVVAVIWLHFADRIEV